MASSRPHVSEKFEGYAAGDEGQNTQRYVHHNVAFSSSYASAPFPVRSSPAWDVDLKLRSRVKPVRDLEPSEDKEKEEQTSRLCANVLK